MEYRPVAFFGTDGIRGLVGHPITPDFVLKLGYDNGIKFFCDEGLKLPDAVEHQIEAMLEEPFRCVEPDQVARQSALTTPLVGTLSFVKG